MSVSATTPLKVGPQSAQLVSDTSSVAVTALRKTTPLDMMERRQARIVLAQDHHAHSALMLQAPRASASTPSRTEWSADQYARFSTQVREYLEAHPDMVPHHAAWHQVNGPGGTKGEGSGIKFLGMHHAMVQELEGWIAASGRDQDLVPLTEWRPNEAIPEALGKVERFSNKPNIQLPTWLTTAGGAERAPIFGYTQLADFKNPDELGRALGTGAPNDLGYHGAGHAAVGGTMWSAQAPTDPVFWLYHKHIDGIIESWLATENGRAWLATPEGAQWRDAAALHHHGDDKDPVQVRTQELLRLRDSDQAAYQALLSKSSFEAEQAVRAPADALPFNVRSTQRFDDLGVSVQVLADRIDVPWETVFAPDGRMFFTERNTGKVRVIRDGVLQAEPVLQREVGRGEGGMLGMALDPNFATNKLAYLYYTKPGNRENVVVRVALEGPDAGRETVLVSGINAAGNHCGGRITIGADGKLYIGTGDAGQGMSAQRLNSLNGKVLRVNLDGTAPADNPFVGRSDADPRIWSYGHRNVQGLSWNSRGDLIETELGGSSHDEINLIKPGKNYGWPTAEGDNHLPNFEPPLAHAGSDPSWAPSGGTMVSSGKVPQFQGRYVMAMLGFGRGAARGLRVFEFDANNKVISQKVLFQDVFGRVRNVVQGPDGYLYVSTSNKDGRGSPGGTDDQILRIIPLGAE